MGLDAAHVGELGMSAAPDREILEHAVREQQVVVTLDADFHALLALNAAARPSVVRVRIEGLRSEALVALIVRVLDLCKADLEAGAMATVDEHSVRIRLLPLGR
jgi:predicted nuclease of predicted toxin-antitoxin system